MDSTTPYCPPNRHTHFRTGYVCHSGRRLSYDLIWTQPPHDQTAFALSNNCFLCSQFRFQVDRSRLEAQRVTMTSTSSLLTSARSGQICQCDLSLGELSIYVCVLVMGWVSFADVDAHGPSIYSVPSTL